MDILQYIIWYYFYAPIEYLKIWLTFIKFVWFYLFPVPVLLKTLFSPWKKDVTSYAKIGFDPSMLLQTFSFNMVSRFIGAFVRLVIIVIDIAFEVVLIAGGAIVFVFWMVWPAALIISIVFANVYALILLSFIGLFSVYFYKISNEKAPDQLSKKEIFRKEWIKIIWERLGVNIRDVPKEVFIDPENNLQGFLDSIEIKKEYFDIALIWEISRQKRLYVQKRFWREENLFATPGIARDLIYGYAPMLDRYSQRIDALTFYERLIGRRQELESLETSLSKSRQANVLIIGEPGVGKMSLVQKFARLVEAGDVVNTLAHRRVILLKLNEALAGLGGVSDIENKLISIFEQASTAGNIILVIDDFHNFLSNQATAGIGTKDISQIISPYLERGSFQLIAITTYTGLHEHIENRRDIMKFFEKIEVKEPDKEMTLSICQDSVREIEMRTPVRITVQAIKEIIEKADLFITDMPFPEKAIDLLEESAIYVATKTNDYFVEPSHVDTVISQKTEIPVGHLTAGEKEKLLNLEDIMHMRVINQVLAVKDIASAMRRSRLNISEKSRPVGSFLFLGPTGVGKTETAKALAEAYFGSEDRINRFDMSEFQGVNAVNRMIGSRDTNHKGLFTTAVRENPYSLLLLDEIEKSDSSVLNLFLQILEEGWLTDAFGRKVNFRNQIIIATSNAGAEMIRTSIGNDDEKEEIKKKLLDNILSNGIFRPEFVNRFDSTIIFTPLSREHLLLIAELMLKSLKKRLEKEDLIFIFNKDLVEKVAELGYDPANGARPMRRVIQSKIEDVIAGKLLREEIEKDKPFEITVGDIV